MKGEGRRSRPTIRDSRLSYEVAAWDRSLFLVGIDEVGRGPLAGPVVAAAVALPIGHPGILGVRDSKAISRAAERVAIAGAVRREARAIGIGAASVREIAELNIRRATALAMQRALRRCLARLEGAAAEVWVDGLAMPELDHPHTPLVKGDALCHSIGAAAIVAKVTRDRLMERLAERHPAYGWASNVGYGSAAHLAALRRHGLTAHHREQFCRGAVAPVSDGA
ncbi:MAG TPA: ribonuclease HII [Gemmatimonadales bacterium]|nr:ribonuclease HII [Gemmatimonadales bacterium]